MRQAQPAIEDAVGAEVDVGREAQLLGNRLLRAHLREQRRQGSGADDAVNGHAEAALQSTCVEHGVSSSVCKGNGRTARQAGWPVTQYRRSPRGIEMPRRRSKHLLESALIALCLAIFGVLYWLAAGG